MELNYTSVTLNAKSDSTFALLCLRICCLALIIALIIFHVKTILMFRLEQVVSSGTYMAYIIILFGMIIAMALRRRLNMVLEIYFMAIGAILFSTIGVYILFRWKDMDRFTEAVAQLLEIMGTPVKKNNICKAVFSIAISWILIIDIVISLAFS